MEVAGRAVSFLMLVSLMCTVMMATGLYWWPYWERTAGYPGFAPPFKLSPWLSLIVMSFFSSIVTFVTAREDGIATIIVVPLVNLFTAALTLFAVFLWPQYFDFVCEALNTCARFNVSRNLFYGGGVVLAVAKTLSALILLASSKSKAGKGE